MERKAQKRKETKIEKRMWDLLILDSSWPLSAVPSLLCIKDLLIFWRIAVYLWMNRRLSCELGTQVLWTGYRLDRATAKHRTSSSDKPTTHLNRWEAAEISVAYTNFFELTPLCPRVHTAVLIVEMRLFALSTRDTRTSVCVRGKEEEGEYQCERRERSAPINRPIRQGKRI